MILFPCPETDIMFSGFQDTGEEKGRTGSPTVESLMNSARPKALINMLLC
jgi:hypothetical protein